MFGQAHDMRQKAVVTGGAGFIGSHLVDALLRNFDVTVLDDFSSGKLSNLPRVKHQRGLKIIRGDIRNKTTVSAALKNAYVVFHEAAKVSVLRSVENPILTNDVNVNGTLNLLHSAVKNRVTRFVYASSSSVYGEQGRVPKNENMRPMPLSPYAVSKLSAESYCRAFYKTYGLKTVSLRYFNVYGPRQRTGPYSGVITLLVKRARKGLPAIIFGDGEQTRDFTYVSDVVQANLSAMEKVDSAGDVFNIGTGSSVSINSLARTIYEIHSGRGIAVERRSPRPGDVRYSRADISKARKVLGYSPRVSLREGLEHIDTLP